MKKLSLLVSAAAVLTLWNGGGANAAAFSDVPSSNPYSAHINDLQQLGITDGIAPGQFGPSKTLTRAEFAKFVVAAFDLKDSGTAVPFQDIQGHWAASYIRAAYQAGMVNGTSDTMFTPEQPVKREEAAAMIWRFAQRKGMKAPQTVSFKESPDAWADTAVAGVLEQGWYGVDVTQSGGAWSYRPRDNMTRQEMAALLDQSLTGLESGRATLPARSDQQESIQPDQKQQELMTVAKSQLGVKWEYGKQLPGLAFDCSNFTSWVYKTAVGDKFSSSSRQQRYNASIGKQVILDSSDKFTNLQVGDLLFFSNSADPGDGSMNQSTSGGGGHVGMYAGEVNGKHYIIQDGGGRAKVTYEPMEGTWFAKNLVYAKRILN